MLFKMALRAEIIEKKIGGCAADEGEAAGLQGCDSLNREV